jgi:hypothetical protein
MIVGDLHLDKNRDAVRPLFPFSQNERLNSPQLGLELRSEG